jgi:hypothetical protein
LWQTGEPNGKAQPHFDWHVADEQEWQWIQAAWAQEASEGQAAAGHKSRLVLRLSAVLVVLLCLVAVGGWLWQRSQAGLQEIEEELRTTTFLELQAVQQGRMPIVVDRVAQKVDAGQQAQFLREFRDWQAALPAEAPTANSGMELTLVNLQEDLAVVELVTAASEGKQAFRQTRFYRRTGHGWLRTPPDAALWGSPHSLGTKYFMLHFRQQDAKAVTKVAAQLDQLYVTLLRNLGLPLTATAEKVVVEIDVAHMPSQFPMRQSPDDPFVVPSPALYLAPMAMSDTDVLAQAVVLALLDELLYEIKTTYHAPTLGRGGSMEKDKAWSSLLDGLRLWQLWASQMPLSAWREPVVWWVYNEDREFQTATSGPDPCSLSRLWLTVPLQLQDLLLCDGQVRVERAIGWRLLYAPPTTLQDLGLLSTTPDLTPRVQYDHPAAAVAVATLLEYVAATYGQERIPVFVASFDAHDQWATAVPALFGVSATEFERGWQEYLADQYKVELNF